MKVFLGDLLIETNAIEQVKKINEKSVHIRFVSGAQMTYESNTDAAEFIEWLRELDHEQYYASFKAKTQDETMADVVANLGIGR